MDEPESRKDPRVLHPATEATGGMRERYQVIRSLSKPILNPREKHPDIPGLMDIALVEAVPVGLIQPVHILSFLSVETTGFEPITPSLRARCSTIELSPRGDDPN